jgi:hypothetical protein
MKPGFQHASIDVVLGVGATRSLETLDRER